MLRATVYGLIVLGLAMTGCQKARMSSVPPKPAAQAKTGAAPTYNPPPPTYNPPPPPPPEPRNPNIEPANNNYPVQPVEIEEPCKIKPRTKQDQTPTQQDQTQNQARSNPNQARS